MTKICLNYLGIPSIIINDHEIKLPNQKITGLVFYIFFEREVLRTKLATLFWEDKDENLASGNLRNALYLIKKVIPESVFVIDRKTVKISPDLKITSDLEELNELSSASQENIKKLGAEFLSGLEFEGEEFHTWLHFRRQEYAEKFAAKLDQRIEKRLIVGHYDDAIHCLKLLISRDNLDESTYMRLMTVYADIGQVSKGIKLYGVLSKVLGDELDIKPCQQAKELYLRLINSGQKKNKVYTAGSYEFFGRQNEKAQILSHIRRAEINRNVYIGISGPTGIGKSAFVEHILPEISGTRPLWCRAYEASEKYNYSPWNGFFKDLSSELQGRQTKNPLKLHILKTHFPSFEVDYDWPANINFSPLLQPQNPIHLGELLADVLNSINTKKRKIIILEDFQWFDQASLEMLQSVLANAQGLTVLSLYRSGEGDSTILERILPKNSSSLCKINLTPFNQEETSNFCQLSLGRQLSGDEKERIYQETEGIPLYVTEYLNLLHEGKTIDDLSAKIAGIIENRISFLSDAQRRILEYLSAFTYEAFYLDFVDLFNALERNEEIKLHLAEDLEQLCRKNFIRERISDSSNLKLQFTHDRIKTYVYAQMNELRRRNVHAKIAAILERMSMRNIWDKALENETIHHHHKTANEPAALNFQLGRLRRHVAINHELFPLIEDSDLRLCGLPFSTRENTEKRIQEASDMLYDIKSRYPLSEDLHLATALFQELSGSYNIYFGNYKNGEYAVRQALKYAVSRQKREMIMRCLLQLSFVGIQLESIRDIVSSAKPLYAMGYESQNNMFIGVALRFLGVCKQIEGRFETAEKVFLKSIERFERLANSGEAYTLNIVAANDYIGETYHRRGMPHKAMEYFERCLESCHGQNLFWGRPLFHSNIAYVALCLKDYDNAEMHVNEAIKLFETTPGGRKSSIAYSLKALLEALKGKHESALKYLQSGDALCQPIQKKSWMALQFWVKSRLKAMPEFNKQSNNDRTLAAGVAEYEKKANDLFQSIHFNPQLLPVF